VLGRTSSPFRIDGVEAAEACQGRIDGLERVGEEGFNEVVPSDSPVLVGRVIRRALGANG